MCTHHQHTLIHIIPNRGNQNKSEKKSFVNALTLLAFQKIKKTSVANSAASAATADRRHRITNIRTIKIATTTTTTGDSAHTQNKAAATSGWHFYFIFTLHWKFCNFFHYLEKFFLITSHVEPSTSRNWKLDNGYIEFIWTLNHVKTTNLIFTQMTTPSRLNYPNIAN